MVSQWFFNINSLQQILTKKNLKKNENTIEL